MKYPIQASFNINQSSSPLQHNFWALLSYKFNNNNSRYIHSIINNNNCNCFSSSNSSSSNIERRNSQLKRSRLHAHNNLQRAIIRGHKVIMSTMPCSISNTSFSKSSNKKVINSNNNIKQTKPPSKSILTTQTASKKAQPKQLCILSQAIKCILTILNLLMYLQYSLQSSKLPIALIHIPLLDQMPLINLENAEVLHLSCNSTLKH